MKYKELLKYFTMLGLSVTVLYTQPIDTYATEQTITTEETASVANASDFVIENGVLKDYTGNDSQVVIPSGVTSIGDYAFENCDSIVTVTIPNGVTNIGNYAFKGCDRLESVTISKTVERIEQQAFNACGSLTNVNIQGSGLTFIGYRAFYDCVSLQEIILPKSMKIIGEDAFRDCSSLTKAPLQNGITTIHKSAFENCDKLTEVSIPSTVVSMGDYVFFDCDSVKKIVIQEGVTSIGAYTFGHCDRLEEVSIPGSILTIGNESFKECINLKQVTIGNGVQNINYRAFYNCESLNEIVLPNSIRVIGEEVFKACYSLSITIPSKVVTIGNAAFAWCDKLTEVVIPKTVKSIGEYAFGDCDSLKKVTVEDGATSIGKYTFQYCDRLEEVDIPGSILTIGIRAFDNCRNLKQVTIGNGVQYIEEKAFSECVSLKEIILPKSMIAIGYEAFGRCSSLDKIVILDGVIDINHYAFNLVPSLTIYGIEKSYAHGYAESRGIPFQVLKATITTQPKSVSIAEGKTASFTVNASGVDLKYQWQSCPSGSSTWSNSSESGSKTETLSIQGTQAKNGYKYRCIVTDGMGNKVTSNSATLTVTTSKPSTVSGLQIGGRATDALRLNWNKNSNASGYIIEQYKNGKWTRIARIGSNSTTTYRVEKLSAFTSYKFRVQSFVLNGNTATYSDWKSIDGKTLPTTVGGLKIGGRATDALRLNWNKNSNASGYIIEQYKDGKWTRIAKIQNNSTTTYRVEKLSGSTSYKFRVQSYSFDGSTPLYSSWQSISGKTLPTTVSGLKIGGRATDALRLNWNKNSNASGYIIEQYKDGKWTRIAKIQNNSTTTYRVEGLSASASYNFRVQSYSFDGSTPLYSSWQSISGKTLPTMVSGLRIGGRATDALRLNWDKNSNASGYIIEQYKNGKWTRIAKIQNNSTTTYRVEKLSKSTTYKFRVQTYNFDGNTAIYSSWQYVNGTTN